MENIESYQSNFFRGSRANQSNQATYGKKVIQGGKNGLGPSEQGEVSEQASKAQSAQAKQTKQRTQSKQNKLSKQVS